VANFFFSSRICSAFTLKMGLLKVGKPKSWKDSKTDLRYIRQAGVRQFISTYKRVKDLKGDELLWGDETEYGIFITDKDTKTVRLSLRAKEIMDELNANESTHAHRMEGCTWVPEYGAWMIEATPNRPYTGFTTDLLRVERNMRLRRRRLLSVLREGEIAPTVTTFPLLGVLGDDGSVPPTPVGGESTKSDYIGDGIINPHPRFRTLTANIRQRRGENVCILVPLFRDENTEEYMNYDASFFDEGVCGNNSLMLWRYGQGDKWRDGYGKKSIVVGCSASNAKEEEESTSSNVKWLVDVKCEGCEGLFFRSAPNKIVLDADWPRNGEVVVGSEISDIPGWVRLQNGYYLPIQSEDKKIQFLHRVNSDTKVNNGERRFLGASTPQFHSSLRDIKWADDEKDDDVANLLEKKLQLVKDSEQEEESTPLEVKEETVNKRVRPAIHMDAMAFGMGCCCTQVTFQGKDIDESRFIYDQLAVLSPIMMALTAATPILKGRIADTDCRWGIISESVDCRTPEERGLESEAVEEYASNGQRRLFKSRYDSISTYIYQAGVKKDGRRTNFSNRILNMYNDMHVPIDDENYHLLRKAGIDPSLAQHVAHLFVRDPLVVFENNVQEVDDETLTDHFESIQSTNWQTVRWKPPPPRESVNDPHIGWRTEFRSMEMQLTDFENAAFTVFIVLLTRVILVFDLNLYIPISKVDANMQRAHSRNAAVSGKFFFRRHMAPLDEGDDGYGVKYSSMFKRVGSVPANLDSLEEEEDVDGVSERRRTASYAAGSSEENSYEEMTMEEIMMGKGEYFPGLIPLVGAYLEHIQCDVITKARIDEYLDLIKKRATGELVTTASYLRTFVRNHPKYEKDSVVSNEIG